MHWRDDKTRLQLRRKQPPVSKTFLKRLLQFGALGLLFYLGFLGYLNLPGWIFSGAADGDGRTAKPDVVVVAPEGRAPLPDDSLDKKKLAGIIGSKAFEPDELYTFRIEDGEGHSLFVRTTMDPALQSWAVNFMPKVLAKSTALVAIDPKTGEVLAMASHNAGGQPVNVALTSSFPAASLFKIVTAAAAVEKKKLSSDSTISYDGGKHTLYKKDIKGDIDEGSHQATLKQGFAESINSVFGKLGAFSLGPKELESFAKRFHFNQPIHFEMPVEESQFTADQEKDPYRLAELASGFNRMTTVSPLHGAMLASAIVNNGKLMEPTVVRDVFDLDNNIYYQHEPVSLGQVVSESTVQELRKMMRAAMTEGTGRKSFGDAASHKVLSKLEIGGKSGTINNDQGDKVDWFVTYARRKGTDDSVAMAVLVVHGEKLGLRSRVIIKEALIQYFKSRVG